MCASLYRPSVLTFFFFQGNIFYAHCPDSSFPPVAPASEMIMGVTQTACTCCQDQSGAEVSQSEISAGSLRQPDCILFPRIHAVCEQSCEVQSLGAGRIIRSNLKNTNEDNKNNNNNQKNKEHNSIPHPTRPVFNCSVISDVI